MGAAGLQDWVVRASWLQDKSGCFDCSQAGPVAVSPQAPGPACHSLGASLALCWFSLMSACTSPGLADDHNPGPGLMSSKFHLGFSPLQCQDLLSQTSSPLSQNDSCAGRSADLLLPPGDTGRRRQDSLHDPAALSRAERFRIQVGQEGVCRQGFPSFLWAGQGLPDPCPAPSPCQPQAWEEDSSLLASSPVPGTQSRAPGAVTTCLTSAVTARASCVSCGLDCHAQKKGGSSLRTVNYHAASQFLPISAPSSLTHLLQSCFLSPASPHPAAPPAQQTAAQIRQFFQPHFDAQWWVQLPPTFSAINPHAHQPLLGPWPG